MSSHLIPLSADRPDAGCRGYDFEDCCPLEHPAGDILAPYELPLHDDKSVSRPPLSPALYLIHWGMRRLVVPLVFLMLLFKILGWVIPA
jgi:hypothetical protein